MSRNEADTRAQLIDPVLPLLCRTEDLIRHEETVGEAGVDATFALARVR